MSPFYLCIFLVVIVTVFAKPHHHKKHHKHRHHHKRLHREEETPKDLEETTTAIVPHIIQDQEDLHNAVDVDDDDASQIVSYEKSFLLEIAAKLRKYVHTISDNVQSLDENVLSPLNRTLYQDKKSTNKPSANHPTKTPEDEEESPEEDAATAKPSDVCDPEKLGKNKIYRTDANGDISEIDLDEECERRMQHKSTTEVVELDTESSNSEKEEEEDAAMVSTTKKPRIMDPKLMWKKRSLHNGKGVDVFAEMFLNKDF